jgi:hypothetical protein
MNKLDIENIVDLCDLYKLDKPRIYKNHMSFYDAIIHGDIDWPSLLPRHYYETFKLEFLEKKDIINSLDSNLSYIENIKVYRSLFNAFKTPQIDRIIYRAFLEIEKNNTIKSCIKTFSGRSVTKYSMFKTVTGRLIVKEGPRILTLPARCRKILKSRYESGKIISIDFCNLEPRLALKLLGQNIEGDIYSYFMEKISFNIDRSIIKRAIISVLYGLKKKSIEGFSQERAKEVFNVLENIFDMPKLEMMAINCIELNKFRRNYFGRPIFNLSEEKTNVLLNNFIQSTAVDISLMCFSELVKRLNSELCVPLFVLHDAIIFDVDNTYLNELNEIISLGYTENRLGHFPLSMSTFN